METKEETEIWLIEVGYCIIILQILFFVVLFVFISIYLFQSDSHWFICINEKEEVLGIFI